MRVDMRVSLATLFPRHMLKARSLANAIRIPAVATLTGRARCHATRAWRYTMIIIFTQRRRDLFD